MHTRAIGFRGVIANLIIPFDESGYVVWDRVRSEAELLCNSDVDGLCVGGFMSETEGSSAEELFRLCETVSDVVDKPVVAMIYPDSQPEASELVCAVASGGAEAVFVAQPHYLCQPNLEGLIEMFGSLRSLTNVPVLLANCQRSAMLSVENMFALVRDRVIDGILVGGEGAHLLVDLLCLHLDVPVFSAIEDLHYVNLLMGAEGMVSDMAAAFPELMTAMYRAYREGKHDEAREHHERLVRLWRVLEHPSEQRARMRKALEARGRHAGEPRSPYNIAAGDAYQSVHGALVREGVC